MPNMTYSIVYYLVYYSQPHIHITCLTKEEGETQQIHIFISRPIINHYVRRATTFVDTLIGISFMARWVLYVVVYHASQLM